MSEWLVDRDLDCRAGMVYFCNRYIWEHDELFKAARIAIYMETAMLFIVDHENQISRGALLLVSDLPMTFGGVQTEKHDAAVRHRWADIHLQNRFSVEDQRRGRTD